MKLFVEKEQYESSTKELLEKIRNSTFIENNVLMIDTLGESLCSEEGIAENLSSGIYSSSLKNSCVNLLSRISVILSFAYNNFNLFLVLISLEL